MSIIKFHSFLKVSATGLLLSVLAGCGGDGSVIGSNTASAVHCVDQTPVAIGAQATNTCSETIIILTDNNERLVIPAGGTHTVTEFGFLVGFGACFSPNEPKLSSTTFTCG